MTNLEIEMNAIRFRQGSTESYLGVLPASMLCGEWGEKHIVPDRYNPESDEGYQRNVTPVRVKDFARYIIGGRPSPTALRLNVRDINVNFRPFPNTMDYGKLEIPEELVLYVVDGQHRLEGLKIAYSEKKSNGGKWEFDFPVIISKFSRYEEAVDFAVINKTQKGLKTDLTDRVLRKIADTESYSMTRSLPKIIGKDLIWRPTATKVCDRLNESSEVWKGRVIKPNAPRTDESVVTETTLVSSLEVIINTFEITDSNVEKLIELLDQYWIAIKKLCPISTNDPLSSVLMKTLGTGVMHKLFVDVTDIADRYHKGVKDSETFYEILETAGEYMQDKFWQEANLYGSGKSSISNVYRMIKEAILSSYYEKQEDRAGRSL